MEFYGWIALFVPVAILTVVVMVYVFRTLFKFNDILADFSARNVRNMTGRQRNGFEAEKPSGNTPSTPALQ